MLYDKRWDAKVEPEADPLSLDSLITWLEKQPADEVYCFDAIGHCLLAQYFTEQYGQPYTVGNTMFGPYHDYDKNMVMPAGFNSLAAAEPHTFGAALERARQHQFGM